MPEPLIVPDFIVPGRRAITVVSAAEIPTAEQLDGWDMADVVASPDRAFLVGRYAHAGLPANRNGHIFRQDQLERQHHGVPNSPLDMLHDRKRIVGSFVKTKMIYPGAHDARIIPQPEVKGKPGLQVQPYVETPYIKALAVVWSYLFPEDTKLIKDAYDKGLAFFSMSSVPSSVTCPVCDVNKPWKGYTHDSYCSHMQGRNPKWMENPLFVGGAAIVPPVRPGWKDASITRVSAFMAQHPAETADIMAQVAAAAGHASQLDIESITAQLLAIAHGEEATAAERVVAVAPLWERMTKGYEAIDFAPPAEVRAAVDPGAAPDRITRAWAASIADGMPVPPVAIRRLVDTLSPEIDSPARDALGDTITYEWARDTFAQMIQADLQRPTAAGLVIIARDTGRILLLQRALDEEDPASGCWEWPGGCIEPGELPVAAARREWAEEIGQDVPEGATAGSWTSPNGIYQAFVWVIATEAEVMLNSDPANRRVLNPDDPDQDCIETAAWMALDHLAEFAGLRPEVATTTDWDLLAEIIGNLDQIPVRDDRTDESGST